ncbi:OmpA family protein [Pontibacter silvestris]|uniref:OmpA family protein n=1 Tax=Pontibacter silvestris TaxID=2305183 RepID=A0ABW4X3S6_9BACT|nr:OmpA family protein [Pontibacter silvestris]MCC9135786.1 OmpA family protein [Pontibacter silvestris]
MKKRYLLPALLLMAYSVVGQAPKYKKADKYFKAYQFAEAAQAYEKALKSEPDNAIVMAKLVQCYVKLENTERAEFWLNKAMDAPLTDASYYRELAALLAVNGRYTEAGLLYEKAVTANDEESVKWLQAYKNLNTFYEDSLLYKVNKVSFNSGFSDFSPAFYDNGIVFSSSRSNKGKGNKPEKNYTGFIDLFYAAADAVRPIPFSTELNSKYHEGPLSFNATQDTVYFTRSNFHKKPIFNREGVNNLKIYYAVLKDEKWQNIQALPLNNEHYSVGHPALADSHTLYFASDKPGGYGGTDLYKIIKVGGVWQPPVNLGPEVNTIGNEVFPFVDEKGELFFASTGHPGLGGLDIFYAPKEGDNFKKAENVGYPVNTPGDDFGLIVKGDAGYYSSNYKSAYDDIYTFKATRNKQLVLLAVNQEGKPLSNVQLNISLADAVPGKTVTLESSPSTIDWAYGEMSRLTVSKRGYVTSEVNFAKEDFFRYKALDTVRIVMPEKVAPNGDRLVQVTLIDEEGVAILGGKVELTDVNTGSKEVHVVRGDGSVAAVLHSGKSYRLRGIRQGYNDAVLNISGHRMNEIIAENELNLRLKAKELFASLKVGETIELEIEYDLDKADIRPDAVQLLDNLVAYMQKYPGVQVELGAHTDSRGTSVYNHALSQRRAEAAVAYVASKGVGQNRMVAVGYGESQLKVSNAKAEAQHQVNRRTTVTILSNSGL